MSAAQPTSDQPAAIKVAHLRRAISGCQPPDPHTVVSHCALNYTYGVYQVASLRLAHSLPVLFLPAVLSPYPLVATPRLGEAKLRKPHPRQWSAWRDIDRVGL